MNNVMTIGMVVILVVLVFFMFRSSRKRQKQQQELQKQFEPGVHIMTTQGIFATIVSIDDENNKVVLEISPGNTMTVHRQALGRVETPSEIAEQEKESPATSSSDEPKPTVLNGEPLYGERIDTESEKSSKKSDD